MNRRDVDRALPAYNQTRPLTAWRRVAVALCVLAAPAISHGKDKPAKKAKPDPLPPYAVLPSGIVRETGECKGTITGNIVSYAVHRPAKGQNLPVFLHQYGAHTENTAELNERVAGYGIFSVAVAMHDGHCGYELQDYKDAIDAVFQRYRGMVNPENVAIAGASYGGAVVYGMSVRFPYLFNAAFPIFGIADFGYDERQSWYPMILANSPAWNPIVSMGRKIGDPSRDRETRYLVRNAILAAKNNPYSHFEIVHDVADGVGKGGVQVEQSRRFVAELQRLGYTNWRYTETPKEGFVFPADDRYLQKTWRTPIRYGHGFYSLRHQALYHLELEVLKPSLLGALWKKERFRSSGEVFVPSFLEVPFFRFDLGKVENNGDEAADVAYDVSSRVRYTFRILARTELTVARLRLMQMEPNRHYAVTCRDGTREFVLEERSVADAAGVFSVTLPAVPRGQHLVVAIERRGL